MHAWINDKLAIHVDGLISLPFEVAKQANGDVLWSSLWCQILLLYVYWVKKSQQEKGGGLEQAFQSGHDSTKTRQEIEVKFTYF